MSDELMVTEHSKTGFGSDSDGGNSEPLSLDARMRQQLPKLISVVREHWRQWRDDPNHDRIDAMREDVELLLYWLARQVGNSSIVQVTGAGMTSAGAVSGRPVRFGHVPGVPPTELQNDIYAQVRTRRSVTQLVEGAQGDFIAYLNRVLSNAKIDAFRRVKTYGEYVTNAEDLLLTAEDEDRDDSAIDIVSGLHTPACSSERLAIALECLEQLSAFMMEEKLQPKLQEVVFALWLAAPLSDKHGGDISDNQKNTDIALARQLGMPKKTFDRYKKNAHTLMQRFRDKTGW